ncbi:MAG: D-aminoacylase [Anaerolineae bacterium]|nr:D-aminoacylase [Gemmatimonadaceae bacterium]
MTVTRREFLAATSAALAAVGCAPSIALPARKRYDVLISNGTVFDGSGNAPLVADVALLEGRIAAVGPGLGDNARLVIDARDLAVAPGFVDIHSHADGSLFEDPRAESVIRQGITTVVVGKDGGSRGPSLVPQGATQPSRTPGRFGTIGAFLEAVDALPSAINLASMVGLGTVRGLVIGAADRPATASELQRMQSYVADALAQGACGASSGLEYPPGAFASREELIELCRPLAPRGLPYATHMRNEDDHVLEAVSEAIAIAEGARCPLQISHLKTDGPRNWKKIDAVLARIDTARSGGLDVAFDRYPYAAYATGLTLIFPVRTLDGGTSAFLSRIADPARRDSLRDGVLKKVLETIGGWDNIMIAGVAHDGDRNAEGKRLGSYAASLGADPYDTAVALLTRSKGDVGMVGFSMSEENAARFLAHPLAMACTDGGAFALEGPARRGHPHPRGLGSFPRVLGHYVRERKALTLTQAIHKMTAFPASRVKLSDRGRLGTGLAGDVVVFDPATVRDRATFTEPFQYPEGIRLVVVNGQVALRDGIRTEARSGRALRAS